MMLAQPQFGFSITSPFKKVGGLVKKSITVPTKYAYKATKVAAKVVYKAHAIPTKWGLLKPTIWLGQKAMYPVKKQVQKLVHRRAGKIAWDKRKSKTPTPAEITEARNWTRSKLKSQLPHGPALAVFAGYTPVHLGDYQLGVAPAVVAAAIPVLLALIAAILSQFDKSGEAPANPQADAAGEAAAAANPPGGGSTQPEPGEVDMTPVQEAADAAGQAAAEASPEAAAAVSKALAPRVKVPGIGNVQRSHLMLGGAVIGGLLLVMMLKKKSAA